MTRSKIQNGNTVYFLSSSTSIISLSTQFSQTVGAFVEVWKLSSTEWDIYEIIVCNCKICMFIKYYYKRLITKKKVSQPLLYKIYIII